jgi:ribose transport system substrate-binding protein
MRKGIFVVLMLGIFLVMGFGTQQVAAKELVFGMVPKIVLPWYEPAINGFKDQCAEFGVKAEIASPPTGAVEEQVQITSDLITRGVDAINLDPLDPHALTPLIKEAISKGILVTCSLSSDAPDSGRLFYVSPDNFTEIGTIQADKLAELLGKKGKVAFITGQLTAYNHRRAVEGFKEGISKYPEMKVVAVEGSIDDPALGLQHAENILAAYPDLAGFGSSDISGGAILQAVKAKGRMGEVKIVCRTDLPDIIEGIREGGIVASRHDNTYAYGALGARGLYFATQGKKMKGKFEVPMIWITKENVDTYQKELAEQTEKLLPKFDALWE